MKKISKNKKSMLTLALRLMVLSIALIMTASLSFGWFSINKLLHGNDINMNVDENAKFEIAVASGEMPDPVSETDIIDFLSDVDNGAYQRLQSTTNHQPAIMGYMVDESPKNGDDVKIAPGTFGRITFYVIPKVAEDLNLTFYINIVGASTDNTMVPTSDSVNKLLKGHILLFGSRSVSVAPYYHYSDLILDGTFTYDTSEHVTETITVDGQEKDAYKVEIYWIWPATFGQMVFDSNNSKVRGQTVFLNEDCQDRDDLVAYIAENVDEFFYIGPYNAEEEISNFQSMMSAPNGENINFEALGDGYNAADQEIGDNTKWIIVEIDGSTDN